VFRIEQYRIQPTEHYDYDDDKTYVGDAVEAMVELDEQGNIVKEQALFGRVVHGWPSSADKPRIELFNGSDYKPVKAPPNWRQLIVEELTGV